MKILMIAPQPFFSPRGTPFSVYYRTLALDRLGHQVDIVTYPLGRNVRLPGARIFRSPGLPFINKVKIGPSPAKLALDFFLFFSVFKRLLSERYDLVHAHEEGVFFCFVYKLFFWRMRFVYDMHSSLPQQLSNFNFTGSRILKAVFDVLERFALKSANSIITICPDLQTTVESLGFGARSVMIENSLFDPVEYEDRGDEIPDALINTKLFSGKRIVLYTGTFEHYQGLPLLLDSVSAVIRRRPEALFVLIGGNSEQVRAARDHAAKQGVEEHIVFTGTMHPNTVKRFIKKAEVLVSPRLHGTNSPLKIYEYLSSGKPIVATKLFTHTQILSDKESCLVEPTPGALAEGILAILENPDKAWALGKAARELYDKAYGEVPYESKLARVLALAHPGARPKGEEPDLCAESSASIS